MYEEKQSVLDLFNETHKRPGFTAQEIYLRVGKSQAAIWKEISNLQKRGMIEKTKDNLGIIFYIKIDEVK